MEGPPLNARLPANTATVSKTVNAIWAGLISGCFMIVQIS
jgi:hypothetical protein